MLGVSCFPFGFWFCSAKLTRYNGSEKWGKLAATHCRKTTIMLGQMTMKPPPDDDYKGWEPDRCRWTRMYKGVRFRRTPEQLGLPEEDWTAERSYPAWRAWLRSAIAHFDSTGEVSPPPTKKTKPKPRRSKARFCPWRDDPDYPTSGMGTKKGAVSTGEYIRMMNELHEEKARLLGELRAVTRAKSEFKDHEAPLNDERQFCKTLEDFRNLNMIIAEVIGYARALAELRQFAKTLDAAQEWVKVLGRFRRAAQTIDKFRDYGIS